jgi:hypothetical protein
MGIRDWFRRDRADEGVREWRAEWRRAADARDAAAAARLRERLQAAPPLADDLEIEHEMADALDHLIALAADLDAGRLPVLETTHRVVGSDACHFSAPASLPDDPGQASGRVLFTSVRAVFVGGARLAPLPWHAVREVAQAERDVLLVRSAEDGLRFRFNTYTDALAATALARHLRRK